MLHTPEGVAYDAATQALLVPVLVRVGGAMAAAYGVPATLSATAGGYVTLPVRVLNAGASRWDQVVADALRRVDGEQEVKVRTTTLPPHLVATWVSADGLPVPDPLTVRLDDAVSAPGGTSDVILELRPPASPGTYLLLLDVLTPESGPMSAMGGAPAIVRVTVNAAAPTPTTTDPTPFAPQL
jgi:FtsP/CotA-like multicopper oxidase with cupredoxin domain